MSINMATPADWNKLRDQHPAIDRYAQAAIEEHDEIYGGYSPEADPVNHPEHYTQGGVECIDGIQAALGGNTEAWRGFLKGQVIKYVWRESLKHGTGEQCVQKADFYLKKLLLSYQEQ